MKRVRRLLAVAVLGTLLVGCRGGTSSDVDIGARSAVLTRLTGAAAPLKFGKEPRAFYVVAFPEGSAMATARASYPAEVRAALDLGVLALSARAPHFGVRVAWCGSSGWFEDPAYGQKFSQVGEKTEGPAPRVWTCTRYASVTATSW